MNRIRKRILAAALAAVVVITMPGTAAYALEENGQTEYISDMSTELEEANAAEEPETETDDIEKPETADSGTEEPKTETGDTEEKETDIEEITEEEPDSISKENTEDMEQRDTGAEDDSTNLCAHHKEHTMDCGYSRTSEDGEGSPCIYECRICPIEELIAALPDAVTEDNAEDVQEQLNKILDLYRELTAEEQEQIDISRCLELQAALDGANVPAPGEEPSDGSTEEDVAKVEKEGEAPIYVTSLADAFADGNSGATVTLLADVMMSNCINILYNRTFTLDLNGHTISCSYTAFRLNAGGNLTIRDSGENGGIATSADSHAVAVLGALTLEGGRFSTSGDGYNGVNVYNDTVLNVTGEDVYINKLFVDRSQEVTLSAGTYGSITSRNSLDNLLGENCAYYGADGKPLVLDGLGGVENLKTLTGPVTVQKCEHEGVKPTSNDDGTHSVECPYCGYTNEAEDCDYGEEYEYDDTNHWLTCTLCGGTKTEAHTVTRLVAEVSDTVITVREACACGYAEELGTVTLTIPEDLIYGETLDKQITWETDLELAGGMLGLGLDSGAERFYSQSCFLSDLIGKVKQLSAGEHTLEVTVDMTEDIKNPKYAQCSIHFNVFKATLTPGIDTDGSTPTKTYDGTTTVSSDGMGIKLEGIVGDDDVTATATFYEYDSADAGARTIIAGGITLSGDDAENYELSDNTARIDGTIDKADASVSTVPTARTLAYNGEAQTLVSAGTTNIGDVVYALEKNGTYSTAIPTGTDAGSYTVWYKVEDHNNYNGVAAAKVDVTISPKLVNDPAIELSTDTFEYDGREKAPEVTVKDGDTVIPASEYTVEYSDNLKAGEATVTVRNVEGNYTVNGSKTFEITKSGLETAEVTLSKTTYIYDGTAKTPDVTVEKGGVLIPEDQYVITYSNTGGGENDHTNVGTVTVTVTAKADGQYSGSNSAIFTITAGKDENAPNMPDSVMNVPDSCLKVGDVTLPENWEWREEDRDKALQDETAVEAVAVYNGADKDNYEIVTVTVAVMSHKTGDDILYTGAGEKEPTCTETGLGHRECITCHAVVETGIVVGVLGHDYIGTVTKEPTTAAEGEMTYTCSRCGDTYTELIPKKIPEGLWISGLPQSVPYTGSAVKPEGISVYHGDTLLREKTEYTISYKNNTNAGTAQLIVTGKGNYKGKCTAEFTIEPVDLSADSGIAATIATVTETGKNLKPTVTVTWSGKKLKEKKDYTLSYETGIKTASEEGYAVTISGKGNYTGSIERRFYVRPRGTKLLNSAKVTGIKKSYEYQSSEMNDENGDAQGQDTNPSKQDASPEEQNALPKGLEADLKNITVKIGTTTLIQGTDYTVRVENGNAVGTGYVVIEPAQTSDYAGEKRISFNITGTNIKKCFITGLEKSYPYTGQPIMPEIEVYTGKNGTGTQIPSAAYTVSYSNYTNQGKATVTVTGIPEKGCSGSGKATYSIGRLDLATGKETGSITVTMPGDIKYAKGGAKPQPVIIHSDNGVIRIMREGVDYTLKYSNNTAKYSTSSGATSTGSTKKPTLKITGIGNYTGNITENYDINVQDIGDLAIAVTDKVYNSKKKGSYYYSVPKVYDFDGKQLKSGKDYTVQYTSEATGQEIGKTDMVENGTQIRVTVTAAENSNYEGTLSRTYYVREAKDVKDISKVKYDKIAAQQYTGSGIEPEVKFYTLTGKTKNYLTEEDYGIIGYYNNIKRGTATVLIHGTGAYSGAKSITFKITSADNKMIWFGIF